MTYLDSVDPILGSEMMLALDMSNDELSVVKNLVKFKEILSFFKDYPNPTQKILRLTANKAGHSKLDVVWEWCQLNKERGEIVQSLGGEDLVQLARKVVDGDDDENNKEAKNLVEGAKLDKVAEALSKIKEIDSIIERY
jgi:hypothetical protein